MQITRLSSKCTDDSASLRCQRHPAFGIYFQSIFEKISCDLPDWAGSHYYYQIAIAADYLKLFDDGIKWVEVHCRHATFSESIDEVGCSDFVLFNFAIADEVDMRHDYDIRTGKTLSEIFKEESSSAVLVGLKYADQAFGMFGFSKCI